MKSILLSWKELAALEVKEPPFLCTPLVPEGGIIMLHGKWSTGKCFGPGTPVLMANGSVKPVEAIKAGDHVMGSNSTPRRVLETHSGVDTMYRVTPAMGDSWTCNSKHIMVFRNANLGPALQERPVTQLPARNNFLERRAVEFPFNGALPISPYFMGVLLGDGYVENCVQVTTADPEIRKACEEEATSWGLTTRQKGKYTICLTRVKGAKYPSGTRSQGRLATTRNPLLLAIERLGLKGKRSGEKFIPEVFKRSSKEARMALLAGLVDTDGYVNGCSISFTLKSRVLVEDIAFVAGSLGMKVGRIREVRKSCQTGAIGTYYRLNIGATVSLPVRLARKVTTPHLRHKMGVGFKVQQEGRGTYHGFSVDGDHMFLLADFTVVHNSPLTWHLASCIGEGRDFFGMPCRKGRVLYLEVDTPMLLVKDRVDKLPPAENVWFAFVPQHILALEPRVQDEEFRPLTALHPDLVVINTLRKVHPWDDASSETPNLVYSAFQRRFPGAALLFVHHDKKDSQDPKARYKGEEAFSGSQHWADDAQVTLHLCRHQGKNILRLENPKNQTAKTIPSIMLELHENGSKVTLFGAEREEVVRKYVDTTPTPAPSGVGLGAPSMREKDEALAQELRVSSRTARKLRLEAERKKQATSSHTSSIPGSQEG